jgi:hypothetical protein
VAGGVGIGGNICMKNENTIFANNSTGTPETFLHPRWSDNKTYLNYGSAGFEIRTSTGASTTMFMSSNNNVGIGTTGPATRLHVNGESGSLLTLQNNAGGGTASVINIDFCDASHKMGMIQSRNTGLLDHTNVVFYSCPFGNCSRSNENNWNKC